MSLASLLQLGSNPVRQPTGTVAASGKFATPGANPSRLRVTNPETGAEMRRTVKLGKPAPGAPPRVPQGPASLDVFAPPGPPEPTMARPTTLGNKGLLGRLSSSIGNSFGRTNPPLSPSSGFSQPAATPNVAPPTPMAPGTRPLISQPAVTPYQAATPGASSAPAPPPAGPWSHISSSGQVGLPHGAPPPAPAPQSFGRRVMGGLGNIKQAGVRGSLKAVGKGVARGTVLNPAWVASMGVNAGHYGAGIDDILRGPGGVDEGSVSIGHGMSNLAHAVPGVGGATGTAWDWTLGPLVNAASNLGDVAAMGVAAPFSARARQDLSHAGSTLGQSLSNAWHGRTAPPAPSPQESHDSLGGIHQTASLQAPGFAPGELDALARQGAAGGDEQMKWLMSLPDKPGLSPQPGRTAALATQAPKSGGDSAAVLQPGTMAAPPSPPSRGDALGGVLSDQLTNALRTPFSPPFPADAFDGVELGNALGQGGFPRHMAMVNAQAAANHNHGLGQSYDMLMGYRKHEAAMANAQAQQELARSNSLGESMRGRAALMQADPLAGYLNNPAGAHILEQQFPGLRESMQFPESLSAPGGAELMRKPDVSADEAMAWDQLMHRSGQGDQHHGMLRGLLARRLGAEGLESSRKPGWFGMGGDRASLVDQWLKQHLGL